MRAFYSFIIFTLLKVTTVPAAVIEVCANCENRTIQSALDHAQAGDHINVRAGEYSEGTLQVKVPLTIIGEVGAVIKHQGEGDTIEILAPKTTIKNIAISGSGKSTYHDFAAIKVSNTDDCVLEDNLINDSQYGIMVTNSQGCQIGRNKIQTNSVPLDLVGDGIHLWKSGKFKVYNNSVAGHRDGIYLEFTQEGKIEENIIEGNRRYGLHFMFSNDNIFHHNSFSRNDAGVAVMYSKRIKMIDNRYSENKGAASYGLLLKDITDSEIYQNEFSNNTVAIFMEGANRNEFKENKFSNNGWAIRLLSSCDTNKFIGNAFLQNTLEVATNSQMSQNTFSMNYWAEHSNVDLNGDGIVDLPFRPTSFSSYLLEKYNISILLIDSPVLKFLDWIEQVFPAISPVDLRDEKPILLSKYGGKL